MTLTETIDNLMKQHLEDPADEVLRGILLDALLDAGRKRDWHKVKREWEPRAWLKAKGRNIAQSDQFVEYENNICYWLFDREIESYDWKCYDPNNNDHWIPVFEGFARTTPLCASFEECIKDFCRWWNKLKRSTKKKMWSWNPPA